MKEDKSDLNVKGFKNPQSPENAEFYSTPDKIETENYKSCVLVKIMPTHVRKFLTYSKCIPESALHYFEETNGYKSGDGGREFEPHISVLYGIKDEEEIENVKASITKLGMPQIHIKLGKVSIFENDEFDVIKVEVISPDLEKLNDLLKKETSYKNKYPKYNPHITIAYVKKGAACEQIDDKWFEGEDLVFDRVYFSTIDIENGGYKSKCLPLKPYCVSDKEDEKNSKEDKKEKVSSKEFINIIKECVQELEEIRLTVLKESTGDKFYLYTRGKKLNEIKNYIVETYDIKNKENIVFKTVKVDYLPKHKQFNKLYIA